MSKKTTFFYASPIKCAGWTTVLHLSSTCYGCIEVDNYLSNQMSPFGVESQAQRKSRKAFLDDIIDNKLSNSLPKQKLIYSQALNVAIIYLVNKNSTKILLHCFDCSNLNT